MAAPDFLNNGFRAYSIVSCTDVNQIIAAMATELVANGWSDLSGVGTGPFKSPVNSVDGSYMKLTMTRVSATRLQYVCNDHFGLLINNQTNTLQDIDAGGTLIWMLSGPDYFACLSERATVEPFIIARLNVWPETPGRVKTSFVCQAGPRNSAGTVVTSISSWYSCPVQGTSYATGGFWVPRFNYNNSVSTYMRTPTGSLVMNPFEFADFNWNMLIGRLPNMIMCPSDVVYSTDIVVPIDTGTTATFRVVGNMSQYNRKLAIRKA